MEQNNNLSVKALLLSLTAVLSSSGVVLITQALGNYPLDLNKLIIGLVLVGGAIALAFVREVVKLPDDNQPLG